MNKRIMFQTNPIFYRDWNHRSSLRIWTPDQLLLPSQTFLLTKPTQIQHMWNRLIFTTGAENFPCVKNWIIVFAISLLLYYSSLSVLCLLPIGLPCLDRLLTDDLSSIFIVGDSGIIFRVPLGVGTIQALKK